jgi:hypothetical protein
MFFFSLAIFCIFQPEKYGLNTFKAAVMRKIKMKREHSCHTFPVLLGEGVDHQI